MKNSPPLTLKPRHELAAMLLATGRFTDEEVAQKIGITRPRLTVIKRSPLFQVLVTRWKEHVHSRAFDDIMGELMADAPKNIKEIQKLRDGDFVDPKVARVQLGAAALLFDRQIPKTVHSTREITGTVTLEKREASRLAAVAVEDDAIDVETVPVTRIEDFRDPHEEDDASQS